MHGLEPHRFRNVITTALPCPLLFTHPERAALEARHGYDTKHAGHLLRLYSMSIEILRQQVVRVRRPDAAWLREVLGGRYSYDELMALVADLRAELAEAAAASTLPAEPDAAAVEALVVDLQRRALGDARFYPVEGG